MYTRCVRVAALLSLLGTVSPLVASAQVPDSAVRPGAATPAGARAHPRVRIATGVIEGTVAPSGVRMFRGIPYAAPPVGALRWKAPQPVTPWKGVRPAAGFGPQCMQLPIFSDMVFRSNGVSEDCLYLNVWQPTAARAGARLPVLVYFFGGGFIAGDGSEYRYDGESLATKGIVTVTLNYRLGVFGFLAHPDLTRESPYHGSGDYGLLDQAAALGWVRRNIAAFGGDPNRVTIAGESAGSISVSAQMASPLSRKLIAGAIGESGALIAPTMPPVPLAEAEQVGLKFATFVGEATSSPAAADAGAQLSLARLREMPADTLLALASRRGAPRLPVSIDGYFLTATPARVFAAGGQARVPLLVGWNTEESGWRGFMGNRRPTPENYDTAVHQAFGKVADELLRVLPASDSAQVVAAARLLAGARFIAFSTWKWAELQEQTSGRRVFRYLYAHPRPAPVTPGTTPPPTGAVHSAEIEYALGNLATNKVYAWTPEDHRVSEVLEGYFANFVKTGNPNGPGLPAWPAAGTGDRVRTMVIDDPAHSEPEPYRAVYEILNRFYATPTK